MEKITKIEFISNIRDIEKCVYIAKDYQRYYKHIVDNYDVSFHIQKRAMERIAAAMEIHLNIIFLENTKYKRYENE